MATPREEVDLPIRRYMLHGGWPGRDFVPADELVGRPTSEDIDLVYTSDVFRDAPHPHVHSSQLRACGYLEIPRDLYFEVKLQIEPRARADVASPSHATR